MSAQIKITKVGVPSEKDMGIDRSIVNSDDPMTPKPSKLDVGSTMAMSSNNMPQGRKV